MTTDERIARYERMIADYEAARDAALATANQHQGAAQVLRGLLAAERAPDPAPEDAPVGPPDAPHEGAHAPTEEREQEPHD